MSITSESHAQEIVRAAQAGSGPELCMLLVNNVVIDALARQLPHTSGSLYEACHDWHLGPGAGQSSTFVKDAEPGIPKVKLATCSDGVKLISKQQYPLL